MDRKKVLVVGGAGFIGSNTAKLLSAQGFEPVVYDNLSTGNREAVRWGRLVEGDILDTQRLGAAIDEDKPVAVIHFAASAYVGESVVDPAKYYRNNVSGTLSLLEACRLAGVRNLIFSSSCATYGVPDSLPIREGASQRPINPYGRTKLIAEQMLADYAAAYDLHYVALRYFNASGADIDGELGEAHDPETHLIPRAMMAAAGSIDVLEVYGDDYDTPDGTCIRDYIHVGDLARAHVLAVEYLLGGGGNLAVNLGTGRGTSIREILESIRRLTGRAVPIVLRPRRAGDPPALYADPALAAETLGFRAVYSDLDTIIRTAAPFFGLEVRA
ncbi:UDP-glucose 4-epimerase GalE [Shinella sp. 838]|jgi:UDP-arabinose 4-epimerase|uniref:UDP-glucose 4-epimerase GalE n=1 Tax=unclassified Shinella TaxID=2643062 RepID=UPI0003C53FD5|nr:MULTISPECIES: UDP-glucose 4-epimerase GalE [unclassified Shinella]EYR84354.1 UDP-glucose 4-epimerase ExoB [Shinella sp. DD12]MCA0338110.1 UDP-glucose 4-epimerase GalE [Pseudomonadota bacterium]MDG4673434.1 UDP-glucose 4-epimerase GalE [Shinella sp. 838]